MDRRKQIETAVINGSIMDQITHRNTHYDRHVGISKKEAMERTLSEIPVNSVFSRDVSPEETIEDAVLYKAKEIADWMESSEHYETAGFDVRMDHPIGNGNKFDKRTNLIREYETDTVRIILQNNPDKPLGFSLLTAYPNTYAPSVTPTNKNLNSIIHETEAYKQTDPIGKAYMLYRTDPRNKESISYIKGNTPDDSVMYMEIQTDDPKIHHIIKFKETETTMRTVKLGENRKKTSIPSKYTEIRNKAFPDRTFPNLNVKLSSRPIQDEFRKDFPDVSRSVGRIITVIKNSLAKETGKDYPLRDYTKDTETRHANHESFVRKAEAMSGNVNPNVNADPQYQ